MVELYYDLVLAKKRTCNPESATTKIKLVPPKHIEEVKALLAENGYDNDGAKLE